MKWKKSSWKCKNKIIIETDTERFGRSFLNYEGLTTFKYNSIVHEKNGGIKLNNQSKPTIYSDQGKKREPFLKFIYRFGFENLKNSIA